MVEDNEINRAALCAILSSQYTVLEAENGAQALSLLEKYREGISDPVGYCYAGHGWLHLPKASESRSQAEFDPVIVTTSNNSEADEVAALSTGPRTSSPSPTAPRSSYTGQPASSVCGKIQPSFTRFSMTGSPGCTARNISASRSGISCFGIRM